MKNQNATEFLTVFDAGQWRRSRQEVAKMSITLIDRPPLSGPIGMLV